MQRLYWQLIVPRDEHLIATPKGLTPEFHWVWSGVSWSRRPSWDQQALEAWVGSTSEMGPPETANQYLFSAATNVTAISVSLIPRWQLVLLASTSALCVGLALIYFPRLRNAGLLLSLGIALFAISAWVPDMTVIFAQSAMLGIALAVLAGFLRRGINRRTARGVVVSAKSSPAFDRSKSPSKVRPRELVGAASTLSTPHATDVPEEPEGD